ncbi:hypothetical protein WJX74_003053 [Apatococcus lobatus]|uniref:Rieske domain-containing protein n=1 Tax=Apatococcus lobatus TaxID=904363 RepID=A0AAW1QIC5_9CHLO
MSVASTPLASIPSHALAEGQRHNADVQGRKVTLARLGGKLYCFDSTCYHMGGPLNEGDIEDFNGTACVTCPWHHHRISLETGGTLEKGLLNTTCESAPKQRLHAAVDAADGFIYVTINDLRSLASDKYNSQPFTYSKPSHGSFGLQHMGHGMPAFASEARAFLDMSVGTRHSRIEEDEPMSLSQTDSETSEYISVPSPLMPYAGFNRTPASPSPVKARQSEQLRFAQRKVIPFGRHAEARAAIFSKSKPPPMASTQPSRRSLKPGQPTLQDLWKAPSAAAHSISNIDDMEF